MDFISDLLPIVIFIAIVLLDKNNKAKRPVKRRRIPNQGRSDESLETRLPIELPKQQEHAEDKIPWYVQFPEDVSEPVATKEVYKEQQETLIPDVPVVPMVAQMSLDTKSKGLQSNTVVKRPLLDLSSKERVRDGLIMSYVLGKPRAVKPYGNLYQ